MIEFGSPDAPTVLFLHGASFNERMWIPNLEPLSDEFHTVAITQPGHGLRTDERFTLEAAAAETVEWLETSAPDGAVLVGLSGGGYVAMVTASLRPDLVAGLVLSGATASYRGWGGIETKLYGYVFPLLRRWVEPKSEAALRKLAPEKVADDMLSWGVSMKGAGQALRDIPGRDYRAMLADYAGPVMILNGERDDVNRKEETDLLEARPDAQIVTVEDAGHACSFTQAESFNRHVRDFARLHAVAPQ